MDLRISTVNAQIGINTQNSRMHIEQPHSKAHINHGPGDLDIKTTHPRVKIDQSQCYAECGLKSPLRLAGDFFREGRDVSLEGIGRRAEEGKRLAYIENKQNPISDIAYEVLQKDYEHKLVRMPQSSPEISWDEGHVDIHYKANKPDIKWETHTMAKVNAERHKIDIYMAKWPQINIEYVGNVIDRGI